MRLPFALIATLLLTLAACAAPAPTPESDPSPATPPMGMKSGAVVLDKSCKSDADCAVKDVGNCCGYYPVCVNKDSPTDPAGVQAQCRAKGMVGVCGFPSIASCQCRNGQCESAGNGAIRVDAPAPSPNPVK